MLLPLCTARRQNRPSEKTVPPWINCTPCPAICFSVHHEAMERRQNGVPAVQKFLPSSQNEGTSVNTWEEQRHTQSGIYLTQLMVEWAKDPSWGHWGTCLTYEKAWHRTEERQALSRATPRFQPQDQTWFVQCRRRENYLFSHSILILLGLSDTHDSDFGTWAKMPMGGG